MKTVKQYLIERLINSSIKRKEALLGIKAPECLIEQMDDIIANLNESTFNKYFSTEKNSTAVLDWTFISSETKTGNGGKTYSILTCEEGKVNYFPNARYSRYIVKSN